jgi:hypothetical protein
MTGTRIVGYTAGGILIVIGSAGLLHDAAETVPPAWALWFVGGVLAHDLLIAPAVAAAALLLARLPAPWRAALQAGLVVAGSVATAALPLVLGYGRRADNPSILPLDYPRNLVAVLLAVLVALAAGTIAGRLVTARPRQRLNRAAAAEAAPAPDNPTHATTSHHSTDSRTDHSSS